MKHQDFTEELLQLLNFSAEVAGAIRMYSSYTSCMPENHRMERREPAAHKYDIMFLSDVITQFLEIAEAIKTKDKNKIISTCESIICLFQSYQKDNSHFKIQAKSTFDYWSGKVDLNAAINVLNQITLKTKNN